MSTADLIVDDAAARDVTLVLPPVFAIDERRYRNNVRQLNTPATEAQGRLVPFTLGRVVGHFLRGDPDNPEIAIIPKPTTVALPVDRVLLIKGSLEGNVLDLRNAKWLKHPDEQSESAALSRSAAIARIRVSWEGALAYTLENHDENRRGFRSPQLGALHAVHAHWSVSSAPATIVLPTGTGKTETMLAVMVSALCDRVLVLVPSDVLRTQLADKFLTLGLLKDSAAGLLPTTAARPIVAVLEHVPRTADEVDDIFRSAQVIVTTSAIAGRATAAVQARMAHHCTHLFIDEAHHAEAPTWTVFKKQFSKRHVLQFTATPFREDGKPLDGKIIYKYPLRRAQEEDYFRPITFAGIREYNPKRVDAAIARRAVEQLRADADKGHILMARVDSVERAREVFRHYAGFTEFAPVQLHTGIKSKSERDAIRQQILDGRSKIIVCVDMLGEGFDLPELKIAAFHDIRKSLAVTLQLAGRFTRSKPNLGSPTFIANVADVDVQDELRKLYARDPDWNVLLANLSERTSGEQQTLQEFLEGFTELVEDIPLKSISIATSAVVYKTQCQAWSPHRFRDGIPNMPSCEQVRSSLNDAEKTLVVVTAYRVPLKWTDVETLFDWEWSLYVVYWWEERQLLFINGSSNTGEFRSLAAAVAGDSVDLIQGQSVFRTFSGINRLRFQQVGLTELLGRNVRYTGHMGTHVEPAIPEARRRRTHKSVLSGTGFVDGKRVAVGASKKGRIWTFRREPLSRFTKWCQSIGTKLLDDAIDPDEVLRGTLRTVEIDQRPAQFPIAVDWPEEIYRAPEVHWVFTEGGHEWSLAELSLELVDASVDGPLRFAILSEDHRFEYELALARRDDAPEYSVRAIGHHAVWIHAGERGNSTSVIEYFNQHPPVIWFADGSGLEGNEYVELTNLRPPYDRTKIETWDWTGTDIRRESQGLLRDAATVQARVIREMQTRDYAVIFDDDGKGEIADVVGIRLVGDAASPTRIEVDLFHCKYSHGDAPGHRLKDLYEVCGQAQKSVSWMVTAEKPTDIFTHLLRRDALRVDAEEPTRLEKGDTDLVETILEMSRIRPVELRIFIVQPGVSVQEVSDDQLRLLSVTETYLHETYQIHFGVIVSP